jgi:hypothetical protein
MIGCCDNCGRDPGQLESSSPNKLSVTYRVARGGPLAEAGTCLRVRVLTSFTDPTFILPILVTFDREV